MMNIEQLQTFLGWCTVINTGLLLCWFVVLAAFRDQLYRLHNRWFPINLEGFSQLHYGAMAGFKLSIFVFNLSPYIALRLIN